MIGSWRATGTTAAAFRAALLAEWVTEALAAEGVGALEVNLLLDDQGSFAFPADERGDVPNVDAIITLGLGRAHDLDDVPARDVLHHLSRRVDVWRVQVYERRSHAADRDWPDGTPSPGVKMVALVERAPELSHEQFVRHWTERHTPLALRHHVGLWAYRQNVVRRAFTPGGRTIDGIGELHFRTRHDFETRMYDSPEGMQTIRDDVKEFIAPRPVRLSALMEEITMRTAPR
jgi:uncharacterized protein (TIGR02118 family)